jgi:hypothetical protein
MQRMKSLNPLRSPFWESDAGFAHFGVSAMAGPTPAPIWKPIESHGE